MQDLIGMMSNFCRLTMYPLQIFLPLPAKNETVLQPVKTWNIGKTFDFSSSKKIAKSLALMYLKFF